MVSSLSTDEAATPGLLKTLDRFYEGYQAREVRDILPKTRTEAGVPPMVM